MDVFEAISVRRSVRNFQPEPVPRADLERIVRSGIEAPSGCNMQLRQYIIVDDPAVVKQLRPLGNALKTCPAIIIVLAEPAKSEFGEYWIQDASAAVENMLLAATAMGYGTCWIEGALRKDEEAARRILGVPEHLRVWTMIPIGTPTEQPARPVKSLPEEVIHYNAFGKKTK